MKSGAISMVAVAVMAIGLTVAPVSAAGLVSKLLGGDGGGGVVGAVAGTVDSVVSGVTNSGGSGGGSLGKVLDIQGGSAGNSALANAGVGSNSTSPRNILDVNVGNQTLNAKVTGGNGQGGLLNNGGLLGTGLLDGDDDGGLLGSGILGSNLTVGLRLGGLGLDLTVPGIDDLLGGGDGGGGGGGNGPGNGPGNGNGNGGGRTLVGSIDGDFQVSCSVNDGRKVLQMASQAKLNTKAWGRAANVQIIPVKLCPQARSQVAQIFNASGKIQQLQNAAASDALIVASLNRTRYSAGDVFAVEARGGNLTVYVY